MLLCGYKLLLEACIHLMQEAFMKTSTYLLYFRLMLAILELKVWFTLGISISIIK